MKYFEKFAKRKTNTVPLSKEYVILDENHVFKGVFNEKQEAIKMLQQNPTYKGYEFLTYKLTIKNNL